MTSKTLSINLIKGECKRKLWLYVVALMALMLIRPARILMAIDNFLAWRVDYTVSEYVNNILYYLKYGYGMNIFANTGLAIIFAFWSFAYLYSRTKVDLYHSLPISKRALFRDFAITGIVPYVIIETIVTIIIILEVVSKNLSYSLVINTILSTYVYNILFFVIFYSIAVIGIMLTGNRFVGMALIAAIIFVPTIIESTLRDYMSYCFETYYWGSMGTSLASSVVSPILASGFIGSTIGENIIAVVVLLVEAVVLLLLGMYLYKLRPSECTTKAVCYKILQPIIRIPAVILAALLGGIYVVFISGNLAASWYWTAFVGAGLVTHIILSCIFNGDIKKALSEWKQLLISVAIAVVIAVIFLFDTFGFDRYVPSDDSIEYASVSLDSIDREISLYNFVESIDGMELEYDDSTKHKLEGMKLYDIASVKELVNAGINELTPSTSVFERTKNENLFENEPQEEKNEYVIKYHLKNGRNVYRRYMADIDKTYEATKKIYGNADYKKASYQFDEIAKYGRIETIEGYDAWNDIIFKIDSKNIEVFMNALKADYMDLTLDDLKKYSPVVSLSSYNKDGFYGEGLYGCYIYPCFNNTLTLLDSLGINVSMEEKKFIPEEVNSIKISKYAVNADEENLEVTYEAEDTEMIKALCDVMVLDTFYYSNSILKDYETGIDIWCSFTSDKGYLVEYCVMVPRGQLPAKVYDDMKPASEGQNVTY